MKYKKGKLLFKTDPKKGLDQWIFHDENWARVRNFREWQPKIPKGFVPPVRDRRQTPTKEIKSLKDGTLRFDGTTKNDYEWLILEQDTRNTDWTDFTWSFKIRKLKKFREFQFDFRYEGLYNRYRFRFEYDYLFFDKFVDCTYFEAIGKKKFPLKIGKWYDVRIDVTGNTFSCYVNNKLILRQKQNEFKSGSVAIILWEDNGVDDICAEVGPMTIHELVKS